MVRKWERFGQQLTLYQIQVVASVGITCADYKDLMKGENAYDKVRMTAIV
jgi:hypothetical protein